MARKISLSIVSAVLLIFIGVTLFAFPAAAENELNYSYPHATKREELYPDELLTDLLGFDVSDSERDYLRLYGDFLLSHNFGIPTSHVSTDYDTETGMLTVFAEKYEYVANNGVTVVWLPVSLELESQTYAFACGECSISISAPSAESGDAVTVKYKADFIISKDEVNRLLNLTYKDAVKYKAEIEEKSLEYEKLYAQYILDTQKYNEYVANLALYKAYLSEKRIYDEQLFEYNEYIKQLAEYETLKAEYDAYIIARDKYYDDYAKYKEYLAHAGKYEAKLEAYEKYIKDIETVRAQLNVIEQTKTPLTSLERTVYSAIMGDTVTSVIANKDAIANSITGADPATIDRAGGATENLRVLLEGFFATEGERERYNYYVTNYEGFRDNFAELLRTLDKLYMNRKVRGVLISQDKQEKYLILLAQLYYITNALSDEPVKNYDGDGYFDSSYIIGKSTSYYPDAASPSKIINNEAYVTDTDNAAPLIDGYPAEVEKPDIVVVEEPKMPVKVNEPVMPEPVSPPSVENPEPVEEPTPAKKPDAEPIPYTVSNTVLAIVDEYERGLLSEREQIGADLVYSPEISVRKVFLNPETVTVKYYGKKSINDAEELLYEVTVDYGTYADYIGPLPVKMEDRSHTYYHTGWVDANGFSPDFSCITESLSLYADFGALEKEYKTSWIVNGEEYEKCPDEPEISPNGNDYYVFTHWEKTYATDSVTGEPTIDVIWIARFDKKQYVVTDSGDVDVSFDGTNYTVDAKRDSRLDVSALLEVAAGEGGLIINSSNAVLRFSYAETLALRKANVHSLSIFSAAVSSGGYAYSVSLYGRDGEMLEHAARLTFESYCAAEDPTHLFLYCGEGEGRKSVKCAFSQDDKRIRFTMSTGAKYNALVEYGIKPISFEGITITLDKLVAGRDEPVKFFIDKIPGITVTRVYMKHSDGSETDLTENSFLMPADDVSISVDFVIDEYTVSFVSDGKTIASFICYYGDTVTPPTPPNKASDGKYKYTFVGWDAEILPATQDAVYTAIYKQELLPTDNTDSGLQITQSVLKIIVFAASFAGVFLLAAVPSAIIFTVLFIKRKRMLFKAQKVEK